MGEVRTLYCSLDEVLPHVFLPPELPADADVHLIDVESRLLDLVTTTINQINFITKEDILASVKKTFNAWSSLQYQEHLDAKQLNQVIRGLSAGDEFALYIRQQNVALLISVLSSNNLSSDETTSSNTNGSRDEVLAKGKLGNSPTTIVSTFPVSQPTATVTSAKGDLAALYPTTSISVPTAKFLHSECFAQQIASLNTYQGQDSMSSVTKSGQVVTESREVANPMYVSQWLISVLAEERSRQSTLEEMPRIVKKIKDRVLFDKGPNPFRRSGMWVTIKVVIQLLLTRQFNQVTGTCLYKLIILKCMQNILSKTQSMNIGLTLHCLRKTARRCLKLQNYLKQHAKLPNYLTNLYEEITSDCAKTLQKIRSVLKTQWDDVLQSEVKQASVGSINGSLETSHCLKHNQLNEYLSDTNKMMGYIAQINVCEPTAPIRHCSDSTKYPRKYFIDNDPNHWPIILFDFELNVNFWEYIITIEDAEYVWGVFQDYTSLAKAYYLHDPVGTSRLVLICLKIVKVWDAILIREYPMLKEHRPGIETNFTDMLVLPSRTAMHQLFTLEKYFEKRNCEAKYPSLIEQQEITVNSFSARFAKTNKRMQELKAKILKQSEIETEATLKKVRLVRLESQKLQTEIKTTECEYEVNDWKRFHKKDTCKKCFLTRQESKCQANIFEKLLPTYDECQDAVVFELLLPTPIACLRDLLYIFGSTIAGTINHVEQELHGPWTHSEKISKYTSNTTPFLVSLMSSRKRFLDTHYRTHHATNPDSDFIVNNGYNLRIAGQQQLFEIKKNSSLKVMCTLKVTKKSPYSNMQWAINGAEFTYNQVLTKQHECHRDLSLVEFVEYGSLRSGYFIQLRTLYRALTQMTLSLKNESVFNLICQCAWQTGPNTVDSFYRDSHMDMTSDAFVYEFFPLLENIRIKHLNNWKDHYVLLTVIVLALRTISLTQHAQIIKVGFIFLDRCRDLAMKWSSDIQNVLSSNIDAPRTEIDALRLKMIEVNTCCALTYSVDPHHYSEMKAKTDIIKPWLCCITNIYDNCVLLGHFTQEPQQKFPLSLQSLLKRVEETGLNLEPVLHQLFNESCEPLTKFVQNRFSGSNLFRQTENSSEMKLNWEQYAGASHVYYCKIKNAFSASVLQMDIIRGSFLVDGSPVSYLPSSIESHAEFQRVFPQKCFAVHPYPFQVGRFITKYQFMGSYYSFFLNNTGLMMFEHRADDVKLELLSTKLLKNNIPYLLIEEYTHWWNKKENTIEFFKRDQSKALKLYTDKPKYQLDLKDKLLRDLTFVTVKYGCVERRRLAVDVNCAPYSSIIDIVSRLEQKIFVNMWYTVEGIKKEYIVELPRMGLHFVVYIRRKKPVLMSKEYRGMKVADCQQLGTLIGLRSGLLLEDADVNCKAKLPSLLLMPHGSPCINGYHNVFIYVNNIRAPSFFAYEVDNRLRQLKARESQSAWLYLAYLHAITSSALPDPFTLVTGTERAFQILQSGHCWSCRPLDGECLQTLNSIARLAPVRNYYPPRMKTMESFKYTTAHERSFNSPLLCHDGFQIIAQKIFEDSQRLKFLFPWNDPVDSGADKTLTLRSDEELCLKSYWQGVGFSTCEGRVSSQFDEAFNIRNAPGIKSLPYNSEFHDSFYDSRMIKTLTISRLGHKWTHCKPSSPINLIRNLLFTSKDLKGILADGTNFQKEDWRSWTDIDLRDSWLELYDFARKGYAQEMDVKWVHFMTMLAFRETKQVTLDHLLFLQCVATNTSVFDDLVPPTYSQYFMTNEHAFNDNEVKNILKGYAISWENYMYSREQEQMPTENIEDFIDRMRPVYEEEVESYALRLTDKLKKSWPVEQCDLVDIDADSGISTSDEDQDSKLINCAEATRDINFLLKNWYNNLQLYNFIEKVELAVNALSNRNQKYLSFTNIGKDLLMRTGDGQDMLANFCKKPLFVVDFENVIGERDESLIDKNLQASAREIFDTDTRKKSSKEIPPLGLSKINQQQRPEQFPLEASLTCPILDTYMSELKESWMESQKTLILESQKSKITHLSPRATWSSILTKNRVKTNEMWETVKTIIKPIGTDCDSVTRVLISAEIFPRTTPLTLLPMICKNYDSPYLNYIKYLLGAYAVQITIEEKSARCFRYSMKGKDVAQVELDREQNEIGHTNWNPAKNPHWLLFEIEMDLLVRAMQAKVAERMINPTDRQNALLQLNMGEGKTAVIVPLCVLALANSKQLCRVTVLKALYEINHKALISCLGGILLNRRVYAFPCRRDYKLGQQELVTIHDVYKECMSKGGVVMARPEHRLSFQLKAYEKCGNGNYIDGREFFDVQQWLDENVRDILDESDEILQVKYQLIYTIGKQMSVAGGTTRWTVIQNILKILPNHMQNLSTEIDGCVEIIKRSETEAFPFCRLLTSDLNEKLCKLLAQDVINGSCGVQLPGVCSSKRGTLLTFLTNPLVERPIITEIFELFPLDSHREILLILRGLLACGVLWTALSKRWRVNYGINPTGYRRVAVPFRAKDVAAERTEYGHPDIAIILTQLCYYYSGLSDEQLDQCFIHLFNLPDPAVEYNLWISLVSDSCQGYNAIKSLSGVNLKDFYQRTQVLFPALRFNTATINFWLGNVVFPLESKQFGVKIGCSPWDLCTETRLPTTGFSGTNDSKLLLPKTISQKDLPELQGTNGLVLQNLLRRENNFYEVLPSGFSGRGILNKLVSKKIRVLLDVGALMLELNNESVAKVWLEMEDEDMVDAAVYFDHNDKLVVIDRAQQIPVSLELSTYRTRLDRCVIYLDDVHTRGTDLKIPQDSRGCVTLGKGVTKDKLVQGCMRMRKLGQGHSVVFWASREVNYSIRALIGATRQNNIGSREVLEWAIDNSRQAIEDGFIHWANAGVYQAQKLSCQYLYNKSRKTDEDLKLLSESYTQKESNDLKVMYGEVRSIYPFPTIVKFLLQRTKRELEKRINRAGKEIQHNVESIVSSFGEVVVAHTTRYVSNIQRSTQTMDEEQERELEYELEAEQEKEVPPKYKACEHFISPAVTKFIETGEMKELENWSVKLPLALRRTNLWNICKTDSWAQHIYATKDFVTVIKSEVKKDILRLPQWFCSVFHDVAEENARHASRGVVLLLMSPFEADYYFNLFRTGPTKSTLHMFAARISPNQNILCTAGRLLVPFTQSTITNNILPAHMLANLLLFSGSAYFGSKEEQDEYCKIVGFCLQERNAEENRVFEEGGIADGFFVKPEFRHRLGLSGCHFKDNPEALIREIIRVRYGSFPRESHVGKMIYQCRKTFNGSENIDQTNDKD